MFAAYRLWIELAVLIAVIGGAVIGVHKFLDYEQQIGYDRRVAEDQAQAAKDTLAKEAKEKADAQQKEVAERERTLDGQRIEALVAANTVLVDGLRGASNRAISNLSGASAETAAKTAATFAGIFQDCVGRYTEVARKADAHVADIKLLQAAP